MLAHQVSRDQCTHELNDRMLALLIAARECPCEEHDKLIAAEMERAPGHFIDIHLPNDGEIPREDWEAMFGEQLDSSRPVNTTRVVSQTSGPCHMASSSQPSSRSVATQTSASRTAGTQTATTQTAEAQNAVTRAASVRASSTVACPAASRPQPPTQTAPRTQQPARVACSNQQCSQSAPRPQQPSGESNRLQQPAQTPRAIQPQLSSQPEAPPRRQQLSQAVTQAGRSSHQQMSQNAGLRSPLGAARSRHNTVAYLENHSRNYLSHVDNSSHQTYNINSGNHNAYN